MNSPLARTARSTLASVSLYGAMLLGALGAFAWICKLGAAGVAPLPGVGKLPALIAAPNVLERLLLALAVIIVSAKLLGALFEQLKSPPVIGEIVAGILLGPSFLGSIAPGATQALFPREIVPGLSALAQFGVIVYMFFVGLEVDLGALRKRGHQAVAISHASIVVPFVLGATLALVLHPRLSTDAVPFSHFALFCGAAMSVTAFPVLARILSDRGEQNSRLGLLALTCAAVDDVTAWCLLALVVSVVGGSMSGAIWTLGAALVYLGFMAFVARPLARRWVGALDARGGGLDKSTLTGVFIALFASALLTEKIGIHALFGAFALGVVVPAESRVARALGGGLREFVIVVFLPVFFAYTGLRTQIGLVSSGGEWALCALVVATACAGKFGGTLVAARLTGMGLRDSAALGALMNTRGLMELIVLNIGLDLGVITPTFFAMMVIMAVVTTFATTPALYLIQHVGRSVREAAVPETKHTEPTI